MAWSLIWSTLDGLEYSDRGMMAAWEPWSGHYAISVAIWATAQTTQFVDLPKPKSVNAGAQEPDGADNEGGFSMLGVSTGGSGVLAGGGTFVTYVAREPGGAPACGAGGRRGRASARRAASSCCIAASRR